METTNLNTETTRKQNIRTVKQFINLVENRDIPSFIDLFSDDGMQFNYFQANMLPPEIKGKEALRKFWMPIPDRFSQMRFSIEAIYPMLNPELIAIKYRGYTKLKDSGKDYNNEYFALFFFNEEGKIKEYHEYSNPIITAKSFDMLDKISA
jgi:ketosteroid isomerase-like protein